MGLFSLEATVIDSWLQFAGKRLTVHRIERRRRSGERWAAHLHRIERRRRSRERWAESRSCGEFSADLDQGPTAGQSN